MFEFFHPATLPVGELLQFAVNRVTTKIGVVFLLFKTLRMRLSVFRRCIARWRLAFFASFSALESDDFYFSLFSHGSPFSRINKAELYQY